jgi:hypothetical protein
MNKVKQPPDEHYRRLLLTKKEFNYIFKLVVKANKKKRLIKYLKIRNENLY